MIRIALSLLFLFTVILNISVPTDLSKFVLSGSQTGIELGHDMPESGEDPLNDDSPDAFEHIELDSYFVRNGFAQKILLLKLPQITQLPTYIQSYVLKLLVPPAL